MKWTILLLVALAPFCAMGQTKPAAPSKPAPDATDTARREGEAKLKKAMEDEEKAKVAEQKKAEERDKQDALERKAMAKAEAEKKAKAEQQRILSLCVIRPVMTDEDIANCRAAYKL